MKMGQNWPAEFRHCHVVVGGGGTPSHTVLIPVHPPLKATWPCRRTLLLPARALGGAQQRDPHKRCVGTGETCGPPVREDWAGVHAPPPRPDPLWTLWAVASGVGVAQEPPMRSGRWPSGEVHPGDNAGVPASACPTASAARACGHARHSPPQPWVTGEAEQRSIRMAVRRRRRPPPGTSSRSAHFADQFDGPRDIF